MTPAAASAETPAGPLWSDERIRAFTGWTLISAYLSFGPRFARALAPIGLSPTQFGVLVQLDNCPGLTQAALARRCFMTPQSMGEVLNSLETLGHVDRGARPGRGHPISVRLTDSGRDMLYRATPVAAEMNTPEALGLDAQEHAELNAILHKVVEATATSST